MYISADDGGERGGGVLLDLHFWHIFFLVFLGNDLRDCWLLIASMYVSMYIRMKNGELFVCLFLLYTDDGIGDLI